jgi:hypothetical protein
MAQENANNWMPVADEENIITATGAAPIIGIGKLALQFKDVVAYEWIFILTTSTTKCDLSTLSWRGNVCPSFIQVIPRLTRCRLQVLSFTEERLQHDTLM